MLQCGYELSRRAVEAKLCRSIRAESLTRACAEPRWLARIIRQGLRTLARRDRGRCEPEASALSMEESVYTSHSRTLVPLTPSPSVTAALRDSLAALGGPAALARVGLTPAATLFELNVLVSLPGDYQPTNQRTPRATQPHALKRLPPYVTHCLQPYASRSRGSASARGPAAEIRACHGHPLPRAPGHDSGDGRERTPLTLTLTLP